MPKRLFCRYCKKHTHRIDDCKSIICLICNQKGHPRWLCPNKKEDTNNISYFTKYSDKRWVDI